MNQAQTFQPTFLQKLLGKDYKWHWPILSCLVILIIYFLPFNMFFWGMRSVYYPILGFFLVNIIHTYFTTKNYSYLKLSWNSVKLNFIYFSPFFTVLLVLYLLKWYPQEGLSYLNRGIPNTQFVIFYSFISVPLQQTLIFGELFNKLKPHFSPKITVILLATFYSLMHIYYPQPFLILIFTFVFGILWSIIRFKSDSIIGNILVHVLIGLFSFYLQLA
jgi:membrane protease YdiL (CAAX protease family)